MCQVNVMDIVHTLNVLVVTNTYTIIQNLINTVLKKVSQLIEIIEVDPSVAELVKKNEGYCPCAIEKSHETKCICKMFKEQAIGKFLCGRFEKVRVDE